MDNLEISDVNVIMNPGRSGELTAILAGFKTSVNDYLKELILSPVRSLADVITFNQNNEELVRMLFSKMLFLPAETKELWSPNNISISVV